MRRARKAINQINVVPYIDVMLVLLVIFMITAPLVSPGQIELPTVGRNLPTPLAPLQITLNKDDSYSLQDHSGTSQAKRVKLDELIGEIRAKQAKQAKGSEQPVVISAPGSIPYQDVIRILDKLQTAGIQKVGLLARPTPG